MDHFGPFWMGTHTKITERNEEGRCRIKSRRTTVTTFSFNIQSTRKQQKKGAPLPIITRRLRKTKSLYL